MLLIKIQSELKAPKSLRNNFGKYNYRSCECILEALKPILLKYDATLIISDSVHEVGNYVYVEATCTLSYMIPDGGTHKEKVYITTAQAGIEKAGGMALPQAFGSASSYARKYCLNGLFMLDDTKDADATNKHEKTPKNAPKTTVNYVATLKTKCEKAELKFADVIEWAKTEKKKDVNLEANAKALLSNWDKVSPEINAYLIEKA